MVQDNNQSPTDAERPDLSVVIPAHNEQKNLEPLYTRLKDVLDETNLSWEIILVDDGSSDDTWERALELHHKDGSVKGIRLSRSFGHQYALFAGLVHSTGTAVITMDADLQHPPEVIPDLLDEWRGGSKVVNTVRSDPEDFGWAKRLMARFFYRAFSFLSGVELEQGMADFRLLDRQVVNEILRFREEGLFLRGLVEWMGYSSSKVTFQAAERFRGDSKYTMGKMLKLAWHGVSSFSILPLRIGVLIGIGASLVSFYLLARALYAKIILETTVPGWTSIIGTVTLLFGILFIFLSLLGEYIGRVLIQVRRRPLFIVAESVGTRDTDSTIKDEPDRKHQKRREIPDRSIRR